MANTFKPKRSYTASNTPTLAAGELGINAADKKTWIGNAAGTANVLISSLSLADMTGSTTNITEGTNLYYTDARSRSAISSAATGLTYTSGTGAFSLTAGYSIPTTASQTNWDSAYTQRLQWDGGSTGLTASTGRTSLGATTVGSNLFTLTNPSAVTFPRINADNTVSTLDAATFRTAIGAGTSSTTGTVTSIATTSPITGGTITGSGTIGINASSANTASYVVQRDASGSFSAGTITATLSGNATNVTGTVAVANGGTGQTTATAAFNALAPSQTSNSGKYLTTDGSNTSWGTVSSGTTIPSGCIQMYGGSSAPSGWLFCDGSAVSRTTYASLFTAIGTVYGQGDGSTTFTLPDMRSKVVVGAGSAGGTITEQVTLNATNISTTNDTITVVSNTDKWLTGQAVVPSVAVPTGVTAGVTYYVIRVSATTIKLATSFANAVAGTPTVVDLTATGSGTMTLTRTLSTRSLGQQFGDESAALVETNLPAHTHAFTPAGTLTTESSHTHTSANAGSHNHTSNNSLLMYVGAGGGANLNAGSTYQIYNLNATIQNNGDHSHGSTNGNSGHTHSFNGSPGTTGNGNGTASPVVTSQPSIAINYIIKT